jgi:kynurenine 3-monooxygenase
MERIEGQGKERIAIVGAGLVGSLLSVFLARRGFEVELFERRADLRRGTVDGHRSINLAVSTRGLHALEAVGLRERVLSEAVPMRGRMVHPLGGGENLQPYGKDDSECINSISRAALNALLLDAAEATGRVRMHFRHRLLSAQAIEGRLLFETPEGEKRLEFDRVFGTDGSASALRQSMVELARSRPRESLLDHGYKELSISPEKSGGLEMNALHIWPRRSFMLIALPNRDRSYTCTLFLSFDGASESFEKLETGASVRLFFEEQFPDVLARIPDLEEQFFAHPTGRMVTIKTEPWNAGGRALLLGDAAHAIVPFFGQGMNCGFEDCERLDQGLGRLLQGELGWDTLFTGFSRERKPNADAIADMAVENFVEMRDKVADPRFQLEKQVERVLSRAFPDVYVPRYSLVTFSRVGYRKAYQAGLAQAEILSELCSQISAAEEVSLDRAGVLIDAKLAPLMREL